MTGLKKFNQVVAKARADWHDAVMKEIMPVLIYHHAKSGERERVAKAAHWIESHRVRIKSYPDREEIWMGQKLLSDFRVRMQGSQLQVSSRKTPHLTKSPSVPISENESENVEPIQGQAAASENPGDPPGPAPVDG